MTSKEKNEFKTALKGYKRMTSPIIKTFSKYYSNGYPAYIIYWFLFILAYGCTTHLLADSIESILDWHRIFYSSC